MKNYKVMFTSDAMNSASAYIQHYGKKGMKWGVVHEEKPVGPTRGPVMPPTMTQTGPKPKVASQQFISGHRYQDLLKQINARSTPKASTASKPWERSIAEYEAYIDSAGQYANDLNTSLEDRGIWNGVLKQFLDNPGRYREELTEIGEMINTYMVDAYNNLNVESKPMFDEFQRDFLNIMTSKGWVGMDQIILGSSDLRGKAVKKKGWTQSFSSPELKRIEDQMKQVKQQSKNDMITKASKTSISGTQSRVGREEDSSQRSSSGRNPYGSSARVVKNESSNILGHRYQDILKQINARRRKQ